MQFQRLCFIAERKSFGNNMRLTEWQSIDRWVQYPFKLKTHSPDNLLDLLTRKLETDGQLDRCSWDLETAMLITICHYSMQCAKPHKTPGHVDMFIFPRGLQSHQSLMFGSHADSHQWYTDLRVLEENTMSLYESASTHWVIIYLSYWSSQYSTRVCMFVSDKVQCLVKSFSPSRFLIYLQVYGQAMSE